MEGLNFSTILVLFWKWLVNGCEQALHVAQQHYAGCSNNNKQSARTCYCQVFGVYGWGYDSKEASFETLLSKAVSVYSLESTVADTCADDSSAQLRGHF